MFGVVSIYMKVLAIKHIKFFNFLAMAGDVQVVETIHMFKMV